MTEYLKKILPRLHQFSSDLDKLEIFIDKHWIYIDDNGDQHSYIFKRDGRLIMSLNGDAQTGKWEFLSEAKSLHIDRNKDQILLNQALIFSGLMLLKKDGSNATPWVLINRQVIPDLNYIDYLRRLVAEKMQLRAFKLNDGKTYYYHDNPPHLYQNGMTGSKIYDENFNLLTGDLIIGLGADKTLIIKDGFIKGIIYRKDYRTIKGVITICQHDLYEISLEDEAYINNVSAQGYYQFAKGEKVKSIEVNNGKVISIKNRIESWLIALLTGCLIVFLFVLLMIYLHRHPALMNDA